MYSRLLRPPLMGYRWPIIDRDRARPMSPSPNTRTRSTLDFYQASVILFERFRMFLLPFGALRSIVSPVLDRPRDSQRRLRLYVVSFRASSVSSRPF